MLAATWGLVVVTFFLVIMGAWYAWETRKMVKRMDMEREQSSQPVLTFQLIPWDGPNVKLRIQNLGNGPASMITGVIESSGKTGASFKWSYPLLGTGKYEEFGFPVPVDQERARFNFSAIRETFTEVRADFTYYSVYGLKYTLKEKINIKEITDTWLASKMLVTGDHPDRILPRLARTLEEISKNTKKN